MESSLSIFSSVDLSEMSGCIAEIVGKTADFVHFGKENRYFLFLKTRSQIPHEEMSDCIGKWLIGNYEAQILKDLFDENFEGFTLDERQNIILSAAEGLGTTRRNALKRAVSKELSSYLCDEEKLNIDGFVAFRLRAYRRELEKHLFDAVEEFFYKEEYEKFILLLADHVEASESPVSFVHVVQEDDGAYSLFDFENRKIKIQYENPAEYLDELFLSEEERLLGVLLTLCPKKLVWHKNPKISDNKFAKTVERIFGKRFSICGGCPLCGVSFH